MKGGGGRFDEVDLRLLWDYLVDVGCEEGELVADTGAEGALSGGLEFGLLRPGESGGVSSVYYMGWVFIRTLS